MSKTDYTSDYWGEAKALSICEVNGHVLSGVIGMLLLIIFGTGILAIFLSPFFYGTLYLIYGVVELPSILLLSAVSYFFIICVAVTYGLTKLIAKIPSKKHKTTKESYIGHTYRSIKNKICVPVKIVE
jgi:membrane protein implicated in regulation of membrane protease activity